MIKKILKITGIVVGVLLLIAVTFAIVEGISPLSFGMHNTVNQNEGKALDGFDAISYFNGSPVKGSENHSFEWNGALWLFASEANKNVFQSNPDQFKPQYGGYCVKAVSAGFAAPGDPRIWLVKDNKLFIFSNQAVKDDFLKDPANITAVCDKTWKN